MLQAPRSASKSPGTAPRWSRCGSIAGHCCSDAFTSSLSATSSSTRQGSRSNALRVHLCPTAFRPCTAFSRRLASSLPRRPPLEDDIDRPSRYPQRIPIPCPRDHCARPVHAKTAAAPGWPAATAASRCRRGPPAAGGGGAAGAAIVIGVAANESPKNRSGAGADSDKALARGVAAGWRPRTSASATASLNVRGHDRRRQQGLPPAGRGRHRRAIC